MNCSPHPTSDGTARGRNSMGESSRPSQRSSLHSTPGAFHGSAMLGVSSAPLANEVSRPGPSARSRTVTCAPRSTSAQAVLTPSRPLPMTTTFMASYIAKLRRGGEPKKKAAGRLAQ